MDMASKIRRDGRSREVEGVLVMGRLVEEGKNVQCWKVGSAFGIGGRLATLPGMPAV